MKKRKLRDKIKTLRSTSKGKAIFKLIMWGIFFSVLFLFCGIMALIGPIQIDEKPSAEIKDEVNKNNDNDEDLLVKDFIYYKNKFSEGNYNYTYNITIGDSKYIFDGSIVNNVNSGYKESNMGIIKYYLDETGVYQELAGNKVLISNLYENLNSSYFSLQDVLNSVSALNPVLNNLSEVTYPVYEASNGISKYVVEFVNEEKINITISEESVTYSIVYMKV
ncbi:MAG: hypothetical protein HFI36_01730 [Bacilli bacterium]|jgi:hypothetical protein|nr:hypothetical protein [Bacilli bacterium]